MQHIVGITDDLLPFCCFVDPFTLYEIKQNNDQYCAKILLNHCSMQREILHVMSAKYLAWKKKILHWYPSSPLSSRHYYVAFIGVISSPLSLQSDINYAQYMSSSKDGCSSAVFICIIDTKDTSTKKIHQTNT